MMREIWFHHSAVGGGVGDSKERIEVAPSGENYNAWRVDVLSHEDFEALSRREQAEEMMKWGILAPSTHNTQPWGFEIDENGGVGVFLDRDRVLPGSDYRGRQAVVSVGALIAHVEMAANHYGLRIDHEFNDIDEKMVAPYEKTDYPDRYVKLSELTFSEAGEETIVNEVMEAIISRRVNRNKKYDLNREVPERIVSALESLSMDGVEVSVVKRESGGIQLLATVQSLIDGYVASLKKFYEELGDWMHVGTDNKFGMPTSTFLVDDQTGEDLVKDFRGEIPHDPLRIAGMAKNSLEGIQNAPIVGMVTVEEQNVESWIRAGIVVGKVGNILEREGVENAFFAGIAEAVDMNFVVVSPVIKGILKNQFSTNWSPAVLFRSGYGVDERPPHSPRANLEELMMGKS